jgi:hypothetical protein
MSPKVVREMVYNYCELNHSNHRFNEEEKAAGKPWLKSFLKRHPLLPVRVAGVSSMQSGSGFDRFHDVLEKIMFTDDGVGLLQRIPAVNIFNVDESGLTICKKRQSHLL